MVDSPWGSSIARTSARGDGPLTATPTVISDENVLIVGTGSRPMAGDAFAARSQTKTRHRSGGGAAVHPTGRGGGATFGSVETPAGS